MDGRMDRHMNEQMDERMAILALGHLQLDHFVHY